MKEAESLKDKAERQLYRARNDSYLAEIKEKELQKQIDEKVKQEKERIKQEKEEDLKRGITKNFAKVGSLTFALCVYCFVMTALWLTDHGAVLKTIPEWFVNRWHNLQSIWGGIVSAYSWSYSLLEPHMNDFIAGAITVIVMLVIAALIGFFVLIGCFYLGKKINDVWWEYKRYDMQLLKVSVSIAIVLVCVPLAVFMAEFFENSWNVISWWLVLAFGINVLYHVISYNRC